jgi:outer membrane immunogenic protein
LAADLRAPIFKAPPPVDYYNWTGFYLGTHTGVAVGNTQTSNVSPYGGFDAGFPLSYDLNPVGLFGGVQLGYNWQMANWVIGLEADVGYLGVRQHTYPAPGNLVQVEYGWYGTFTGRLGLAWDRMLSYVKGGGVVARVRNTASDFTGGVIDASDFSETTENRLGWVIGTGFE